MSQGIKKGDTVFLPQFITLSDNGGHYMSSDLVDMGVWGTILDLLNCNKLEPDANCTFEVIRHPGGRISLKGTNGKIIKHHSSGNDTWFGFWDGAYGADAEFDIVRAKGNQIYLHMVNSLAGFVTSRQNPSGQSLHGSTYAGAECLFTVSEPIVSKEIISIDYDLPKALMLDVPPIIALNTTVRNDSKFADVQQTLAYSYQRSNVGTWNNTAGIELGVETSFSAEVPFISSADFTISLSSSRSREWGGSEGTEETVTSSTQITVPPGKKGTLIVLVKRKAMDITFRCKEKVIYKDGTSKITDKEGVYHNVESYAVDVKAVDWEDA